MSKSRTLIFTVKTALDDRSGIDVPALMESAGTASSMSGTESGALGTASSGAASGVLGTAEATGELRRALQSPLTAKIIALGLCDAELGKGKLFYEPAYAASESLSEAESMFSESERARVQFEPLEEMELLMRFWGAAAHYTEFVSFGGVRLEAPFLMMRSAVHRIKPSKSFGNGRVKPEWHLDLLQEFSQHGVSPAFPIEFYAKRFGLQVGVPLAPVAVNAHLEAQGQIATGATPDRPVSPALHFDSEPTDVEPMVKIARLYEQGRVAEIAERCWRDTLYTLGLYRLWREQLKM